MNRLRLQILWQAFVPWGELTFTPGASGLARLQVRALMRKRAYRLSAHLNRKAG